VNVHVHLKFSKKVVGASSWLVENAPEMLQHPKGQKEANLLPSYLLIK
jgi:hypothetical protein